MEPQTLGMMRLDSATTPTPALQQLSKACRSGWVSVLGGCGIVEALTAAPHDGTIIATGVFDVRGDKRKRGYVGASYQTLNVTSECALGGARDAISLDTGSNSQ